MRRGLAGLGVVLSREAVRVARRRRTWGLRGAATAILALLVLITLHDRARYAVDVADLARTGRALYEIWLLTVAPFAVLVAPITVAAGVAEEREDETLDLLAISGLGPAAVLLGKIGSRLLALLTVVLGALPVLAMVLGFGGVAVGEVVGAAVNVTLLAIVVGGLAGLFTLRSTGGPLLPAVAALAWLLPGSLAPLLVFVLSGGSESTIPRVSPVAGMLDGGASAVLPAILHLPVLASIATLGLTLFRLTTSDDSEEEPGLLSTEIWALEAFRTSSWLGATVLTAVSAGWWVLRFLDVGDAVEEAGAWLLAGATAWVVTRLYMTGVLAGMGWLARNASADGRVHGLLEPRRVWRNPVLWRDLKTRAAVGLQLALRAAWLAFASVFLLGRYVNGDFDDELHAFLAMMAWLVAGVGAPLLITASLLEERRTRMLSLLALTPLGPRGVLAGKVGAALIRTLPWVVAGWLLIVVLPPGSGDGLCWHGTHFLGEPLWQGRPAVRELWGLLWGLVIVVELALVSGWLALVLPPRTAWGAAVALPVAYLVAVPFVLVLEDLVRFGDAAAALGFLWMPWADEGAFVCGLDGTPASLVASVVVHLLVLPIPIGAALRRIGRA